jgi:hypothetical protein
VSLVFGPIALSGIAYPHYELAIPIPFLTTSYALSREKVIIASIAFLLMLLVREDAGFHTACFFIAYALSEGSRLKYALTLR